MAEMQILPFVKEIFMVTFKLGNQVIEFDEMFECLNQYKKPFIEFSIKAQSLLEEEVDKLIRKGEKADLKKFVEKWPEAIYEGVIDPSVEMAVDFLVEEDIYDCDEELFEKKYMEDYFAPEDLKGYKAFKEIYSSIENSFSELQQYREAQKMGRMHWQGGGFGIGGAIKGAITAGAMNLAMDAVRGIGDSFTAAGDRNKYENKKKQLAKDEEVWEDIISDINDVVMGVYKAFAEELSSKKDYHMYWNDEENINRADAIFNNVQNRIKDSEKKLSMMKQAIQLNPYEEEYYEYLYLMEEMNKTEVKELAFHLWSGRGISAIEEGRCIYFSKKLDEKFFDEQGDFKKLMQQITELSKTPDIERGLQLLRQLNQITEEYADRKIEIVEKYLLFDKGELPYQVGDAAILNGLELDPIDILKELLEVQLLIVNVAYEFVVSQDTYSYEEHNQILNHIIKLQEKYHIENYPELMLDELKRMKNILENQEDIALVEKRKREKKEREAEELERKKEEERLRKEEEEQKKKEAPLTIIENVEPHNLAEDVVLPRFCGNCGARLKGREKFCGQCGVSLQK